MAKHKRNADPAPTDDEFMPETPTEDILKHYMEQRSLTNGKRDTNGDVNRTPSKYTIKLLACLSCRTGMLPMGIAQMVFDIPETVSRWLSRMHKGGPDALYDGSKSSRHSKIDPNLNPYH